MNTVGLISPPVQDKTRGQLAADPRDVGPLTAAHRQELTLARERTIKIRRAARIANFNGWATAVVAVLSAPFALFGMFGLATCAALSFVAWNEFRGRKRLLAFDPAGASLLGWNQLGLLAMILVYCAWMIHTGLNGVNSVTAQLNSYAELESALGSMDDIEALCRQLVVLLYGCVALLSIVFQGANAYYYFTRRMLVEGYVDQTPEWVRDLQRASL